MPPDEFSIVKSEPLPDDYQIVSSQPAPTKWQTIYRNAPQVAEDLAKGAIKRVARAGQQIGNIPKVIGLPGLSDATDALYGLPAGASMSATEPANTAQTVGGVGAELAVGAAAGAADAGMVYTRNAAGQFVKAPFMGTQAGNAARSVSGVAQGAVDAASKEITAGGPMTEERVGKLIYKYGKGAAKAAVAAAGLRWVWNNL